MPNARLLAPLLVVVALAAAVVAWALAPGAASAAPTPAGSDAGVTVTGTGTASAVPDVVRTTLGAETTAPSVDAALGATNEAAQRIVDALLAAGVERSDVQTAGVQLYPQYGPEGLPDAGYAARQDLTVTLRDVGAAGALIAAAVEAGGDAARLSGVSFGVADESGLREQAREEAFADARAKAEQYAELVGRELGAPVSVREEAGASAYGGGDSGGSAESAAAVPLAPGTSEVSVTTTVRWSLR